MGRHARIHLAIVLLIAISSFGELIWRHHQAAPIAHPLTSQKSTNPAIKQAPSSGIPAKLSSSSETIVQPQSNSASTDKWTLNAVGDIIEGRYVYRAMRLANNFTVKKIQVL